MKPILICADPPEVRGNIKMIHPMIMENPDISEEEDQPMTLSFHKWVSWNVVIDPMIIIYWLKCILSQSAVD